MNRPLRAFPRSALAGALFALAAGAAHAGVLPEERADAMWKVYDGGGLQIDGPAVLVRKNFKDKVSVNAEYYVDQVSGASIDMVVLGASELREERTQKSLGVSYLRGKTTYSASATSSVENDYDGNTANLSISQDMFGDLTTVTLSAGRSWDTITKVGAPDFREQLERRSYGVGVSQIVTKHLIMAFDYEAITEEGYLQNPYRAMRFLNPGGTTASFGPETYPGTRTTNAATLRARYFLPWRAAASASYRYFFDTWDIRAHTAEVGYTHPLFADALTVDFSYRYYTQDSASFYSDLFPREDFQNYMARDKELASSTNQSVGVALTWDFMRSPWRFLQKSSASLRYDRIMYRYDDFRDASVTGVPPGEEPLYQYDANVVQAYVSIWF